MLSRPSRPVQKIISGDKKKQMHPFMLTSIKCTKIFIFSTSDGLLSDVLLLSKVEHFQRIGLKCTDRPQMYSSLIGSETEIGLKCTESASNVHLRYI